MKQFFLILLVLVCAPAFAQQPIVVAGGGGGGGNTIYTADDSLTGPRTVNGGAFTLGFSNIDTFLVSGNDGSFTFSADATMTAGADLVVSGAGSLTLSSPLALNILPPGVGSAVAGEVLTFLAPGVGYRDVLTALGTSTPGDFVGQALRWDGASWVKGPIQTTTAGAPPAGNIGAEIVVTDTLPGPTKCWDNGTAWVVVAGPGGCP